MTKIGDRISDDRGFWVVVGVASENGTPKVSRVRAGSLAHQVFVSRLDNDTKQGRAGPVLHDADCPMTNADANARTACICDLPYLAHGGEPIRDTPEGG